MRKRILFLILISFILLTGFKFNDLAPHLRINCTLGEYTIYFPNNIDNELLYDEVNKQIINVSSSTKYGYINIGINEYQVYFPTYNTPYYRISNSSYGYTYYYLEQIEILDNYNVTFYSKFNSDMTTYISIIVVVMLFWNLFIKR